MPLNAHLTQVLEIYDPQRLNAILVWLNSELKDMFSPSEIQVEAINRETAINSPLDLNDLVQFSILEEFGPDFGHKPTFQWLQERVIQKVGQTILA
jgi:hypothetical protein